MTTTAVIAGTPYYVLLDGNRRIGPRIVPLNSGIECLVVFGFSDKGPYDKFCMKSQLALTPYPLVKDYLRNPVGASGESLKLVVVDAPGPGEPCLYAATMEAVLEAQEKRTSLVKAGYRLMLDLQAEAYRVEKSSV